MHKPIENITNKVYNFTYGKTKYQHLNLHIKHHAKIMQQGKSVYFEGGRLELIKVVEDELKMALQQKSLGLEHAKYLFDQKLEEL